MSTVSLAKTAELQHYWMLLNEATQRLLIDPADPTITELADDLDLLREYSEWPEMREKCTAALSIISHAQASLTDRLVAS